MTERVLIFAMGILAGFLLMLFVTEDAEADAPDQTDLDQAIPVALDYWAQRGLAPPCRPTFEWIDQAPDGWDPAGKAFAPYNSCAGYFLRPYWVDTAEFCETVVHEVGHMVGLTHEDPRMVELAHGGVDACPAPPAKPRPDRRRAHQLERVRNTAERCGFHRGFGRKARLRDCRRVLRAQRAVLARLP